MQVFERGDRVGEKVNIRVGIWIDDDFTSS
jgi:hypothetical protein